jgi:hydrogenase maturation protein HypF
VETLQTYRLKVSGLVQGVGFRPFVFTLAKSHKLNGWVENRNDGVTILVNGTRKTVLRFRDDLLHSAPEVSSIESVEIERVSHRQFDSFQIQPSENVSDAVTEIGPDIAVCEDCLVDMLEQPHRINYPLINCTRCGPRFSIITGLPYDRPNTTMVPFVMCPVCRSEYEDVTDRRFHAQPVACNQCGPAYKLVTHNGPTRDLSLLLSGVKELVSDGGLLAVKGTGGFHLMCDAFNEEGVHKLRAMKQRDGKPFAVMFRSADEARAYVEISAIEEKVLTSWRRPIVLLKKKRAFTRGIADGLSTLGIMLPYMPFHHLLFQYLETPAVVLTSGNFSDEPILISDEKVTALFSGHIDGVVSYNREIYNRIDDSVVTVVNRKPMVIRRARGYAPSPIKTSLNVEGILGTGAELTGSFCMGKGNQVIMSQYIGDLKNLETLEFYTEAYSRFCRLFRFYPELVVSDLHPDYLSSRFADRLVEENPGIRHIRVQHHHAHIASVMLDRGLEGEVLGFSFDGTGLGSDGHIWGAEIIRADYLDFERLFHFEYVPLPGGDKAIKEPWRMGLSYLYHCYGKALFDLQVPLIHAFKRDKAEQIILLVDKQLNTPRTSGAGRLFDAVAAIIGLNYFSTYQAEAPMLLESVIDPSEKGFYDFEVGNGQISFVLMIRQIVNDLEGGASPGVISSRFHNTIMELVFRLSMQIRADLGLSRIVLGGGTFQNKYLSEIIQNRLVKEHFEVYLPGEIPVNDQGIAAGQLAVGAHRRMLM